MGAPLPAGDYAIVELFGHRSAVGRITQTERYGSKMLQLEILFKGALLPPVWVGGAAIYQLTPCAPETAQKLQAEEEWELPPATRQIRAAESPTPAPEVDYTALSPVATRLLSGEDGIPF